MKRCPECRLDYYDDTLLFCLEDGTALVQGSVLSPNEPQTAILHETTPPNEVATRAHIHMTDQPAHPMRTGDVVPEREGVSPPFPGRTTAPPASSIAVLPFSRLSSDPDDEYFCDGLAEELINALAKIDDLKVVARTSAFSFKGKNVEISQIGSALNVKNIIEGSVRKFGDRMRITVQLINASDGYHVWSEKYDTDMHDLFDAQDRITLAVVDALKKKLFWNTESDQIAPLIEGLKHHASDVEAYQLYLRGKFFFNKFTPDDFYRALDCFHKALEIDPNYAAAYAGLADAHVFLTEFGPVPPREAMPKAKEAALKAIALDPTLADAHASLALVLGEFEFDFVEAEKACRRAVELNPNSSLAHQYYGGMMAQLGRHAEAEIMFLKAFELDPLSPAANWIYPFGLFFTRRYDECIEKAKKILELDPNFSAAILILSFAYQMKEDFAASVEAYARFVELCGAPDVAAAGRRAFAQDGWQGFLQAATSPAAKAAVTSYMTATYYDALGDNESALEFLEGSFEKREGHIVMLKADPRFEKLRSDGRFRLLIDRIGF